jgi:hypothetical protein
MRRFTATMDSLAKTLTFVVLVILVIPFITIVSQYIRIHEPLLLLGPAIVALVLFITMLYRPKEYLLDAEGLHIIRPMNSVHIPLYKIRSIMPVTTKELGFGLRAFGSGGFLGYFGVFYYRNYGRVMLYATDRSKMLLITLDNDRRIIISPDDTDGFMAAFQEMKR